MKKIISAAIALCVVLCTTFTAFAADNRPTASELEDQIQASANYITNGKTYSLDSAVEFYYIVSSGADVSSFKDAFLESVKSNLSTNSGKLVSSYGESLATYGAVINVLYQLGMDPTNFNGYNIVTAFEAMGADGAIGNSYYYDIVIPAAAATGNDTFGKALCEYYINTYYVMGQGAKDDWGYYTSDTNAMFLSAISFYADDYASYVKDAVDIMENTYKVDGGYCSNPTWGTDANADSTGLALRAYSNLMNSVPDDQLSTYFAKINGLYKDLCAFESDQKGVFNYYGSANMLATTDAFKGISAYYSTVLFQDYLDNQDDEDDKTTTNPADNDETTTVVDNDAKDNTEIFTNLDKKSPATGSSATASAAAFALLAATGTFFAVRKKVK